MRTDSECYERMTQQLAALLSGERDALANMANMSALLFLSLEKINWAGFYLYKEKMLVLGPFQGKPACVRIQVGKGVCGTAAQSGMTQLVGDVHQFPGHIACDSASRSEIVIPLFQNGSLLGVLDIDSPILNRFDENDKMHLENLAEMLIGASDFRQM